MHEYPDIPDSKEAEEKGFIDKMFRDLSGELGHLVEYLPTWDDEAAMMPKIHPDRYDVPLAMPMPVHKAGPTWQLQRDSAASAAYHIKSGFAWDSTPQGPMFWVGVFKALEELVDQARRELGNEEK